MVDVSTRVWKALVQETAAPPTAQLVLRWALGQWRRDPATRFTEAQHHWLTQRLKDLTPFAPHEQRKLVPPLLAWSHGTPWEAAMIAGLRGTVEDALLPPAVKRP